MLVDDKSQLENGNLRMGTIMKDNRINCNIMQNYKGTMLNLFNVE